MIQMASMFLKQQKMDISSVNVGSVLFRIPFRYRQQNMHSKQGDKPGAEDTHDSLPGQKHRDCFQSIVIVKTQGIL